MGGGALISVNGYMHDDDTEFPPSINLATISIIIIAHPDPLSHF